MPIRPAHPDDEASIMALLREAFDTAAEARLVADIIRAGDDRVSIVHETDGPEGSRIDGYCLLSQMRAPDNCLGLGPVAVTGRQRRAGLGALLIREAINHAVSNGVRAIFCLGEPGYYKRFGFSLEDAARFRSRYPKEYFQILELEDGAAAAMPEDVSYAAPFDAL